MPPSKLHLIKTISATNAERDLLNPLEIKEKVVLSEKRSPMNGTALSFIAALVLFSTLAISLLMICTGIIAMAFCHLVAVFLINPIKSLRPYIWPKV